MNDPTFNPLDAYDGRPEDRVIPGDGRLVVDSVAYDPTTGRAVESGDRLSRLPASRLYAFGWDDNHGPDAFYRSDD